MSLSLLEPTLLDESPSRTFDRRSQLPLIPNQVWQIQQGVVRTVTWTATGELIVLGLWGAGDIFGQPLVGVEPYQAECLSVVKATVLTPEQWHQATDLLVKHIHQTVKLLEIMRGGTAEIMLLRSLTWLAQRFGSQSQGNWHINFNLTHQELADLTGLTRVTVTRLLSKFEKRGLIQRHSRQIIVKPECEPFWHYEI